MRWWCTAPTAIMGGMKAISAERPAAAARVAASPPRPSASASRSESTRISALPSRTAASASAHSAFTAASRPSGPAESG